MSSGPGALAAACQHVHDAAEVRLQSHLPSPNAELTAELHAAIEDFHSAAHMCLAVAAGSPVNYDGEFLSSMTEANRHMSAAQDMINNLLVSRAINSFH
jgi:roadblock/LC7 domain-containing protein